MDSRIEKIIETDRAARERIAKAKALARDIKLEAQQDCEKLQQQTEEKIKKKIDDAKSKEKTNVSSEEEKQRKKNEEIFGRLDKKYAENKDKWTEDIFERVISG